MKLSARNQIKGKVVEVRKGTTTAHVRIDIGNGVTITSSITNEAVDDLGLRAGDEATADVTAPACEPYPAPHRVFRGRFLCQHERLGIHGN